MHNAIFPGCKIEDPNAQFLEGHILRASIPPESELENAMPKHQRKREFAPSSSEPYLTSCVRSDDWSSGSASANSTNLKDEFKSRVEDADSIKVEFSTKEFREKKIGRGFPTICFRFIKGENDLCQILVSVKITTKCVI
eukprot:GHVP01037623.1.p1 GENE.GHVP01037623.1~~GHVP01037623.1.p1  ORF type:complete len:139 (+),score=27.36 GHVP01037623.1:35-451(+)